MDYGRLVSPQELAFWLGRSVEWVQQQADERMPVPGHIGGPGGMYAPGEWKMVSGEYAGCALRDARWWIQHSVESPR